MSYVTTTKKYFKFNQKFKYDIEISIYEYIDKTKCRYRQIFF